MHLMSWFRDLRRDNRGNVLVIGAATLPMLLGAAGLAVDTVQLSLWKRQLQRAADSAALAGAHALAQGASTDQAVANDLDEHVSFDIGKNETPELADATVQPGSFADGTLSSQSCAVRGIAECHDKAVRVALRAERRLPFMHMFTGRPNQIEANGTAAVTGDGNFCMVSMYDGDDPGIIAGGNANLDLSCGVATNARAANNAIHVHGNARVNASPLAAVGGVSAGKNAGPNQVVQPYSPPVTDPYASVQDPPEQPNCPAKLPNTSVIPAGTCAVDWGIGNNDDIQLTTGGVYYVKGTLDLKGRLRGTNVTIVLLGDASNLVQNGGGILEISAPLDGPYAGIAIYRERSAQNPPGKPVKINGGAELNVVGAIYMPGTDVWIGGNTDFTATCLQLIGRKIEFKGGGAITNQCDATGTRAIRQPVVRLVG